jgi:hypothetical protein
VGDIKMNLPEKEEKKRKIDLNPSKRSSSPHSGSSLERARHDRHGDVKEDTESQSTRRSITVVKSTKPKVTIEKVNDPHTDSIIIEKRPFSSGEERRVIVTK